MNSYSSLTAFTSSLNGSLGGSCPQLHTVPLCNLLLEHLVDHFMLLDYRQAFELGRFNLDGVHGAAAPANVLDLEGKSACHSHNLLCEAYGATVAGLVTVSSGYRSRAACAKADGRENHWWLCSFVVDDVHLNRFAYTVRRISGRLPRESYTHLEFCRLQFPSDLFKDV